MCKVVPAKNMPVDSEGNRADIVMDPNSTINRANPGRLFEQYFNASARDTHKRLCGLLNVVPGTKAYKCIDQITQAMEAGQTGSSKDWNTDLVPWDYLMGFYRIVSPRQAAWFSDGKVEGTPAAYLAEIVEKGITIFFPTDNAPMSQDIVNTLECEELGYKPNYGPVTYTGNSGVECTTYKPIRIGGVYMLLLEKIGDDWGSVSSGKLQHHGVLSQLTRNDKYSNPARNQAVRGAGEAEVRIFTAYCGSRFTAELMDRNNNPHTHRLIVDGILSAKHPSNVQNLVDRNLYPFGGAKPLVIVKHLLQTSGLEFEMTPYDSIKEHYSHASVTSNTEARELLKESDE